MSEFKTTNDYGLARVLDEAGEAMPDGPNREALWEAARRLREGNPDGRAADNLARLLEAERAFRSTLGERADLARALMLRPTEPLPADEAWAEAGLLFGFLDSAREGGPTLEPPPPPPRAPRGPSGPA